MPSLIEHEKSFYILETRSVSALLYLIIGTLGNSADRAKAPQNAASDQDIPSLHKKSGYLSLKENKILRIKLNKTTLQRQTH